MPKKFYTHLTDKLDSPVFAQSKPGDKFMYEIQEDGSVLMNWTRSKAIGMVESILEDVDLSLADLLSFISDKKRFDERASTKGQHDQPSD